MVLEDDAALAEPVQVGHELRSDVVRTETVQHDQQMPLGSGSRGGAGSFHHRTWPTRRRDQRQAEQRCGRAATASKKGCQLRRHRPDHSPIESGITTLDDGPSYLTGHLVSP